MGSGKSTVGRALARLLQWEFVDTDNEIVRVARGKSIPQIFAEQGEAAFRDRETDAIRTVCARENCVIATGGGAILRAENRQLLQAGLVVWLTARAEVVVARVEAARNSRPILSGAEDTPLLTHVLTLLGQRGPLYQASAQLIIDTSDLQPDALAKQIARKAHLL